MKRLSREAAIKRLEELYAELPSMMCKGRCHDSCTAIDASELERERVRERGPELPLLPAPVRVRLHRADGTGPRCPALSAFNTCTVYDVRPWVCRAFGSVVDLEKLDEPQPMLCEHGCKPEFMVSAADYFRIQWEIEELSVAVTGVRRLPPRDAVRGGVGAPPQSRADRRRGSGGRRGSR